MFIPNVTIIKTDHIEMDPTLNFGIIEESRSDDR